LATCGNIFSPCLGIGAEFERKCERPVPASGAREERPLVRG
jgi:hypothetical protein